MRLPAVHLLAAVVLVVACIPPGATSAPTRAPISIPPRPAATTQLPTPSSANAGLAPAGAVEEAVVTYVSDGDTIRVSIDGGRDQLLRYIGIDAPEIDGPYADAEPLGPEAADVNRDLVDGKTVFLEKDVSNTDPNGRLLRYVWLKDGNGWLMVNRQLVLLGLAVAHDYRPDTGYSDILFAAQDDARAAHSGIWSN
jgi:endonuclease YncB( thermonuclease family)